MRGAGLLAPNFIFLATKHEFAGCFETLKNCSRAKFRFQNYVTPRLGGVEILKRNICTSVQIFIPFVRALEKKVTTLGVVHKTPRAHRSIDSTDWFFQFCDNFGKR